METMTDSLRLGENDSLLIKFSKSLWHVSIVFETLHGKVAKTRVNVLNSFDRCKTFANIRNLHEGTENHMCPFALTILPLKHFNSHDFKLEQMNKGKMEILAVQNVRVHIYSGWGQKWYIIMWQYCINTGTLNINILLDKIKYSGNATNKTSHLILRWRQPRKLKSLKAKRFLDTFGLTKPTS